jgi:hypothetical protein
VTELGIRLGEKVWDMDRLTIDDSAPSQQTTVDWQGFADHQVQ